MDTNLPDMHGWIGNRRSDGLAVIGSYDGSWVIHPADKSRVRVGSCPCCDQLMTAAGQARQVADALYPLASKA